MLRSGFFQQYVSHDERFSIKNILTLTVLNISQKPIVLFETMTLQPFEHFTIPADTTVFDLDFFIKVNNGQALLTYKALI